MCEILCGIRRKGIVLGLICLILFLPLIITALIESIIFNSPIRTNVENLDAHKAFNLSSKYYCSDDRNSRGKCAQLFNSKTNYEIADNNYLCIAGARRSGEATYYEKPLDVLNELNDMADDALSQLKDSSFYYSLIITYMVGGVFGMVGVLGAKHLLFEFLCFIWVLGLQMGLIIYYYPLYVSYSVQFVNQDFYTCLQNGLPIHFYTDHRAFWLSTAAWIIIIFTAVLQLISNGFSLLFLSQSNFRYKHIISYTLTAIIFLINIIIGAGGLIQGGQVLNYYDITENKAIRIFSGILFATNLIFGIGVTLLLGIMAKKEPFSVFMFEGMVENPLLGETKINDAQEVKNI